MCKWNLDFQMVMYNHRGCFQYWNRNGHEFDHNGSIFSDEFKSLGIDLRFYLTLYIIHGFEFLFPKSKAPTNNPMAILLCPFPLSRVLK